MIRLVVCILSLSSASTNMSAKPIPAFDALPVDKDGPFLNAWGL